MLLTTSIRVEPLVHSRGRLDPIHLRLVMRTLTKTKMAACIYILGFWQKQWQLVAVLLVLRNQSLAGKIVVVRVESVVNVSQCFFEYDWHVVVYCSILIAVKLTVWKLIKAV